MTMKIHFFSLLFSALFFLSFNSYYSAGQIVINEYSASNLSDFPDNYSSYEDWFEIYNAGSSSINLGGYSLSDTPDNPDKWVLPSSITIEPGEFIIFWASGRDEVSGDNYHTNFKLTQTKDNVDFIVIADPTGLIIDQVQLQITQLGHSRGRTPDGENNWSIFTSPSPENSNNLTTAYTKYAEKTVMNIPAGFYTGSVNVLMNTDEIDAEIRYTSNGDIPISSSPVYSGPVTVSSTSVLKARVFSNNPNVLPSNIEFNTYFIDVDHSLAVISISSNTLDELLNGNQSLRPFGTAEYFNLDKIRTTSGYGEFNEHGQDSWVNDQRSIDYITRDECGYNYAIREKLLSLSTRDEFQRVILRASGDDNYPGIDTSAHLRDMFIQKLANKHGLNLDVRKAERCILYVNGIYWGVYSIREKVNDHDYTKYYYDQGKYDLQFLMLWGSTWAEYGGNQAFTDWNALHSFIMSNDMSNSSNYEYVTSQYDVKSLVDYILINSFVVCSDWLNWNVGWWRGLNPAGGHKKWGYILWDEDATFGHYINYTGIPEQTPYVSPCFPEYITSSWQDPEGHIAVLNELRDNAEFDQYYVSRYADLLNTALHEDTMTNLLDSMAFLIEPEMSDHIARWGGDYFEWLSNVEKIDQFIKTRNSILNEGLIDCYSLSGPYQLAFDIEPADAGKIKVNSLVLDEYTWQGSYFGGVDLILRAVETEAEYEFDSWSLNNHTVYPSNTDHEVTLNLTTDDIITAHFVPRVTFDSLVINEINYNSANDFDPGDWVELYNPHDYELNLTNWVFKDEDDLHSYVIPEGTTIEPNGYLVLCQNTSLFSALFPEVDNYLGDIGFGFSGSGELLRLYDESGILVDTVLYDDNSPWPEDPDGNGPSLELINPTLDNALAESWSNCQTHGTPGEMNCETLYIEVPETKSFSLNVYPNPINATGIFVIESEEEIKELKLEIYNSLGVPVLFKSNINETQFEINRQNLPSGIYYCILYDQNYKQLSQRKIIFL